MIIRNPESGEVAITEQEAAMISERCQQVLSSLSAHNDKEVSSILEGVVADALQEIFAQGKLNSPESNKSLN